MSIFSELKFIQNWKRTKEFLLKAKTIASTNSFNDNQIQTLKVFDEFIEENELGLAYEQLIYLSESVNFPKEFWKEMILAANEMKLEDEIKKCESFLNNE